MANRSINIRKVLTDIGASSVRLALSILRGVVFIPVITRLLGVDSYGLWAATFAVVTTSVSVGGIHLKGALIRYTSSEKESNQVFTDILFLSIVAGLLSSGLLLGIAEFTGLLDALARPGLATTAAFVVLVMIVSRVVIGYPRALGNVKLYELFKIIQLLGEISLVVVTLYLTENITFGLLMIGFELLMISGLIIFKYTDQLSLKPEISNFRKYVRYSLPMVPKEISTKLLTNIDKYLILVFLTAADAGTYAIVYSIAVILGSFTNVLNATLYPTVTGAWDKGKYEALGEMYSSIFRWYTILGIPALVGLSILAEPVIRLISTPGVAQEGQYLLPLLGFAFLFRGYGRPLSYIANAAEENTMLAKVVVTGALGNLLLNVLLIPRIGLFGAIVATVIAQIFIALAMVIYGRRKISFDLPVKTVFQSLFASAVMGSVLYFAPLSLSWYGKLIVYPIVGVGIFAAIASLIGLITTADISRLRSLA